MQSLVGTTMHELASRGGCGMGRSASTTVIRQSQSCKVHCDGVMPLLLAKSTLEYLRIAQSECKLNRWEYLDFITTILNKEE